MIHFKFTLSKQPCLFLLKLKLELFLLLLAAVFGPNNVVTGFCYTDWKMLKNDIELSSNDGGDYVLCEDTTFFVDAAEAKSRIKINNLDTSIKCGNQGKREGNCIIQGGLTHFLIGYFGGLDLKGVTMRGAVAASIRNEVRGGGEAAFTDCLWEENLNLGSFKDENKNTINTAVAWIFDGGSNTFTFDHCNFVDNKAPWGAIYTERSKFLFSYCHFMRNQGTDKYWASTISISFSGSVSIDHTCFEDNSSNGWGTVYMRNDAYLLENYKNFGEGNYVYEMSSDIGYQCQDIFHRGESNWPNPSKASSCSSFTEQSCPHCTLECNYEGATLDETSCSCVCPFGYKGLTCSECNEEDLCSSHGTCDQETFTCDCDEFYYNEDCSKFCDSTVTCGEKGYCSDEGSCVCKAGKTGANCNCDLIECNRADACNNKGVCSDGTCYCQTGYSGCECELYCARETTCSDHGDCLPNGTCDCDRTFFGKDCSDQNIDAYCQGKTVSGYKCLPRIDDELGYGMNLVKGEKTMRVIQLSYSKGNVFHHSQLGTFEIPDSAVCEMKTTVTIERKTASFTNTGSYRRYLSAEAGIDASAFEPSYYSSNAAYQQVVESHFKEQQALFETRENYPYYICSINSYQLSRLARDKIDAHSGHSIEMVEELGTHIIRRVEIGGSVSVWSFVSSCVLEQMGEQHVENELDAKFSEAATETYVTNKCDILDSNSDYRKVVEGGDKSLLIRGSNETSQDAFDSWMLSLERLESPGVLKRRAKKMGSSQIIPSMEQEIQNYMDRFQPEEKDISEMDTKPCDAIDESCEEGEEPPIDPLIIVLSCALGVIFLLIAAFCLCKIYHQLKKEEKPGASSDAEM